MAFYKETICTVIPTNKGNFIFFWAHIATPTADIYSIIVKKTAC